MRQYKRYGNFASLSITAVCIITLGILQIDIVQAQEIIINFENEPGSDGVLGTADDIPLVENTVINSQFSSLGVTFSLGQGGNPFIATEGQPPVAFGGSPADDAPAASGVNTLTDGIAETGTAPFEADIAADFINPVSEVSLILIDFRADCQESPPLTAILKAFNTQGNLVDSDSFTATIAPNGEPAEPDGNHVELMVSGEGITRIKLDGTTADCGTAIDNFRFLPAVVDVVEVAIDIKPGSDPNCFNVDGNGVIPVAVLGSSDFAVNDVDIDSLSFAGLNVRVRGNDASQCSVEDVSGDFTSPEGAPDGHSDLVCQFIDDPDRWLPDNGTAKLTGELIDGTPFEGTDSICIVP